MQRSRCSDGKTKVGHLESKAFEDKHNLENRFLMANILHCKEYSNTAKPSNVQIAFFYLATTSMCCFNRE